MKEKPILLTLTIDRQIQNFTSIYWPHILKNTICVQDTTMHSNFSWQEMLFFSVCCYANTSINFILLLCCIYYLHMEYSVVSTWEYWVSWEIINSSIALKWKRGHIINTCTGKGIGHFFNVIYFLSNKQ